VTAPGKTTARIGREEAAAIAGLRRGTWSMYVSRGIAPAPVERVGRSPLWDRSEVRTWAAERPDRREERPTRRPAPTLDHLRAVTTVSIAEASAFLGMSVAAGYRAADDGSLPLLRVGKRRRVPTPALLALVGLSWEHDTGSSGSALPSDRDGGAA
jgi:predicted DNA-binding transcriptional regulator AlpA